MQFLFTEKPKKKKRTKRNETKPALAFDRLERINQTRPRFYSPFVIEVSSFTAAGQTVSILGPPIFYFFFDPPLIYGALSRGRKSIARIARPIRSTEIESRPRKAQGNERKKERNKKVAALVISFLFHSSRNFISGGPAAKSQKQKKKLGTRNSVTGVEIVEKQKKKEKNMATK